jgi:ammonia channel protein AmtB
MFVPYSNSLTYLYRVLFLLSAGLASVCGYQYSSPYLESKHGILDTCGVCNLHGYPSVVGALLSVAFIALDPKADFLEYSMVPQMFRQVGGIISTLVISIISGWLTGKLIKPLKTSSTPNYVDSVWWHLEY